MGYLYTLTATILGVTLLISAPVPIPKTVGPVTQEQKEKSVKNLRQIAQAREQYENNSGVLVGDIRSKDKKPLLSWRVALLPHLLEGKLHKQFKLDEPWDSEHNSKLISKIPEVYKPIRVRTKKDGETFYRGFMGKDTLFEPKKLLAQSGVSDGLDNTIAVIEAGEAVVWTKPESDLPFDIEKELPKLGGLFEGEFHVLMADGVIKLGDSKKLDANEFKKAVTCTAGEELDLQKALGVKDPPN